jgi:hypothetical protein
MNGAGEMTSGERISVAPDLAQEAREWQEAVILYPVYTALSREFVFEVAPCTVLETVMLGALNDVPDHDTIEEAREWLALMDGRTQVHQLRQFLQTTSLADEQRVRALLARHLRKPIKTDADRDKIDFLLVQFFSLTAPSQLSDDEVSLEFIAQILGPMLGPVETESNRSAEVLDEILQDARACKRLSELLHSEILERGRSAKAKAGPNYFRPASMVAFTRFSFLMRRVFFRLMHGDLNAILDGLQELERVGITAIDCRNAQFSQKEPTGRLRMICQSWKVMFHAEYSSGQPLRMLVDLRSAVEQAQGAAGKRAVSASAE